ncbi:MAG: type III pantothenate kinase [Bacteroidota bacterium]|nr:type III pantothenate kinase [Bacteroidota bacterium]
MNRGVVDIGNTRIKSAVFNLNGEIIQKTSFISLEETYDWLSENEVFSLIISSTSSLLIKVDNRFKTIILNHECKIPFINMYETPHTLGTDRIAIMAAAKYLYPNENVLVFDIGTCITIDFLNKSGKYFGGNISPGIQLRFKSMHEMTGRLPLSNIDIKTTSLGNNTLSALANGVFYGILNEINGYIDFFTNEHKNIKIVLTGGDSKYFEVTQKNEIFAHPDWILQGLYYLLKINEK